MAIKNDPIICNYPIKISLSMLEDMLERKDKNDFGEEGIETQFVVITKIKSVTFKEEKKEKQIE